jgi:transposase
MFDKDRVVEVSLADAPGIRYGLCLNPLRAEEAKKTRAELIRKTEALLKEVEVPKRKTADGNLGIRVGKILNKYKVGKFFDIEIKDGKLNFSINQDAVDQEAIYDGFYVIRTDVKPEHMTIEEVVRHYRSLAKVEQAFRNLKSTQLEIRPIYHKTDDRIACHIFICMLSYYLIWHLKQRLMPLFTQDGVGCTKRYTLSSVIERLKSIRKEKISFQGVVTFSITTPDSEQSSILDMLKVSLG